MSQKNKSPLVPGQLRYSYMMNHIEQPTQQYQ